MVFFCSEYLSVQRYHSWRVVSLLKQSKVVLGRRMQKFKLKSLAASVIAFSAVTAGTSFAQEVSLDDIFKVSAEGNRVAQASQTRIDGVNEETNTLLGQYKVVLKEIDGLRVYNAQLQRQINNQNREMGELRDSIERVTLIERQITPLMARMIEGLSSFVSNDVPFLLEERDERVQFLREMMDRADVSPSEKFRRVFEAYQIENDYGRTIEAYETVLSVGGGDRDVNILRIGRVGLYYQSKDSSFSGMWNPGSSSWEALGDEYTAEINYGIRMAGNQTSYNLLRLPIVAPE